MKAVDEYRFIAPFYNLFIEPFLKPIKKFIAAYCEGEGYSFVLDICCGTGTQCRILLSKKINCIGIDKSSHMLKAARNTVSPFQCISMDAIMMALKDSLFDAAIISFALHEKSFIDRRKMLAEAKRVVRPDGMIFLADYLVSSQNNCLNRGTTFIERMAGGNHFRCYQDFCQRGGLLAAAKLSGLPFLLLGTFYRKTLGVMGLRNLY